METIEIQVPTELVQRLRPYQDDLAHLLELGLSYLEEKTITEPMPESYTQSEYIIEVLRQAGTVGPDMSTIAGYLTRPDNQNWQPIQTSGKPGSEIIIEQRRGLIDE